LSDRFVSINQEGPVKARGFSLEPRFTFAPESHAVAPYVLARFIDARRGLSRGVGAGLLLKTSPWVHFDVSAIFSAITAPDQYGSGSAKGSALSLRAGAALVLGS
jgi:hypothetical protein